MFVELFPCAISCTVRSQNECDKLNYLRTKVFTMQQLSTYCVEKQTSKMLMFRFVLIHTEPTKIVIMLKRQGYVFVSIIIEDVLLFCLLVFSSSSATGTLTCSFDFSDARVLSCSLFIFVPLNTNSASLCRELCVKFESVQYILTFPCIRCEGSKQLPT